MSARIRRNSVEEFGVYSEVGAIVVGFKLAEGAPMTTAIFEIEDDESRSVADGWGPYAEIDEKGFYGGILNMAYHEELGAITVEFGPNSPLGQNDFVFEVPEPLDLSSRQLLKRLSDAVASWRSGPSAAVTRNG